jgi:hypothetical protein
MMSLRDRPNLAPVLPPSAVQHVIVKRGFRPLHFLGVGVFIVLALALGYTLRPIPAPPQAVPNTEQLIRMVSTWTDWVERNDPDALEYDYPTLLGCHQPERPWLKGGLACEFGIAYMDETDRRYTVTLDRHNVPPPSAVTRGPRSEAPPAIPY